MIRYVLTPQAEDDLFEIWSYIARDSVRYADRVEAHIYNSCLMLAADPFFGRVRPELTSLPVRFWTVPRYRNYLIVYDPAEQPLRILRILHGARNIRRQLEP